MTQPVDVAYVDIVARVDKLQKSLKDVIDREVKDFEKAFNDALENIDRTLAETAESTENALDNVADSARNAADALGEDLASAVDEVTDELSQLNAELDAEFDRAFTRFNSAWEDFDRRGSGRFTGAVERVRDGVDSLIDRITNVTRTISTGFVNALASIPPLLLPIAIALPPIIGLLVTLAAVVTDAVGVLAALPGALSVLLAIIAPLIIGFQGFGEALGAVFEKDPEKLTEALRNLAPSARAVVLEFRRLLPVFTEIGDVVQQELFAPLVGDITRVMNTISGPLLAGLANVASVLGLIISDFGDVLSSVGGVEALAAIFATTTDILVILRPVIKEVSATILNLVQASLPYLRTFAVLIATVLDRFSTWINDSIESGEFTDFMDSAVASLSVIAGFAGSIIEFFRALFTPETIAAGQAVLLVLTDMFETFTAFLESTAGQRFLEDLGLLAVAATGALSFLLQVLGFVFASITLFIGEFVRLIAEVTGVLDRWKEATENATGSIVSAVQAVPQRLAGFATKFADVGRTLITSFISGFRKTGSFISDVAGDIVAGIRGGLNRMIASINRGIAAIDLALPFSIARIPQLAAGGVAPARPGGHIVNVAEAGEDEAIAPLSTLEDMISKAVSSNNNAITFGPGAINVNFNGAVPTADEARQAGLAVGQGIIAALTRANAQLNVRTA